MGAPAPVKVSVYHYLTAALLLPWLLGVFPLRDFPVQVQGPSLPPANLVPDKKAWDRRH